MALTIKVDGKKYSLPELTVDQWLKVITSYDKANEKAGTTSLFEPASIEASVEFYYALLHDTYPELTKNKLKKMPMYQLGLEFSSKVVAELTAIPLDSEPTPQASESDKKEKA